MATMLRSQSKALLEGGDGSPVKTRPKDALPHGPVSCSTTVPASVTTAPPLLVWKGAGMSTERLLGHNRAVPKSTRRPIAARRPTTIFAAMGPSGMGLSSCPWP